MNEKALAPILLSLIAMKFDQAIAHVFWFGRFLFRSLIIVIWDLPARLNCLV
jgi:hypothetical protein